jgi:hypothetical protein
MSNEQSYKGIIENYGQDGLLMRRLMHDVARPQPVDRKKSAIEAVNKKQNTSLAGKAGRLLLTATVAVGAVAGAGFGIDKLNTSTAHGIPANTPEEIIPVSAGEQPDTIVNVVEPNVNQEQRQQLDTIIASEIGPGGNKNIEVPVIPEKDR